MRKRAAVRVPGLQGRQSMQHLKTILVVACNGQSTRTLMVMQYFRTGFLEKEKSLLLIMGFVFAFSSYKCWFIKDQSPLLLSTFSLLSCPSRDLPFRFSMTLTSIGILSFPQTSTPLACPIPSAACICRRRFLLVRTG